MPFSIKFVASVLLATIYASSVLAAPSSFTAKHSTHAIRVVGRGLEIESYHPASTFETFGTGIDHPLSKRDNPSLEESAVAFVQSHLKINSSSVSYKSGFNGEVAKHAYVKQTHNGIPFANAVANVAFNNDNKVVAFGTSFVTADTVASPTPSISVEKAIATAEDALNGHYNNHPSSIQYLVKQDGTVALTHSIQIQNEEAGTFYDAFVDAHSGDLLHITDFVAKASYLVLPIVKEVPSQGFEVLVDPQDTFSSPLGWHSTGTQNFTTTTGNNAVVFKNTTASPQALTKQSSSLLNFIYPQNATADPTTPGNVDAARTNAFYIVNSVHDIMYRYGFTEEAFNFQSNNFGKGGLGNDPVMVSAQSNAGLDNADFMTPPEGQSPLMRMFLWDFTSNPERDGCLENDIITHENTHGLTNRLTGGGTAACLQTVEAGGLGEGWSDAMAEWTEHTSAAVPDYFMGTYVANFALGVRSRAYSTSAVTNSLRYSSLARLREPHGIGEVWANLLHNVYAALVGQYGWTTTARTDPTGKEGNVVFLHLYMDALSLQPCNPTFTDARDAWIQADVNRYNGVNKCLLWKVFASRGLGVGAANYVDSTVVPQGC